MRTVAVAGILFVSFSYAKSQTSNFVVSSNSNEQSETAIALNPTKSNLLLAGWNEIQSGTSKSGFAFSTNGGSSWNSNIIGNGFDPSVGFDRNGNAFFSCINDNKVYLYRTRDSTSSATWLGAQVSNGSLDDKPWMCVNNTGIAGKDGRIYVAWVDRDDGNHQKIKYKYSNDTAHTFIPSTAVTLSDQNDNCFGPHLVVGASGELFVFWRSKVNDTIYVRKSQNGDSIFSTATSVAKIAGGTGTVAGSNIRILEWKICCFGCRLLSLNI